MSSDTKPSEKRDKETAEVSRTEGATAKTEKPVSEKAVVEKPAAEKAAADKSPPRITDSWVGANPNKRGVPEGLWLGCDGCGATIFRKELEKRLRVCPECNHHFYISAPARIAQLLDQESFEEWFTNISSLDPLGFTDKKPYPERIIAERAKTGLDDACITGRGYLRGRPLVCAVTDSAFIMGSMGSVVGEKLTRSIEQATELKLPLVIVSGSGGGARMHEGIYSLMQMGKVCAALARFHEAGGLYISVLTNPTMGGVAASFASLGDLVFAEPKALVGFAGPRVVQATVKAQLPDDFQTSEFMLNHGFIDRIIHRAELRTEIARVIDYCGKV